MHNVAAIEHSASDKNRRIELGQEEHCHILRNFGHEVVVGRRRGTRASLPVESSFSATSKLLLWFLFPQPASLASWKTNLMKLHDYYENTADCKEARAFDRADVARRFTRGTARHLVFGALSQGSMVLIPVVLGRGRGANGFG